MSEVNVRPVLLLMSPATYRAGAFMRAAESLGIPAISIVDTPETLQEHWHTRLAVSFADPAQASEHIVNIAHEVSARAVIAVDDSATEIAALANAELGFPHNDPESATAARDKLVMRRMMQAGGARTPRFTVVPAAGDPAIVATDITYPCVLKPLRLSGSRGVIRANDPDEFATAFHTLVGILEADNEDISLASVLIEEYLPGEEVAVEGLLTDGKLQVLAIFDKPDPLVGPFFEETIYVTPSRHSAQVQRAIHETTEVATHALGLREGPVHAELRINERGVWLIEVAGRSIGGLCSTILSFGAGMSLEELILRHAAEIELPSLERTGGAVGVMMIPIPRAGILREVAGVDEARGVGGITGVEITARMNYPIQTLPEGSSYLGFIFARGDAPEEVEHALREAHSRMKIRIDAMATMRTSRPIQLASGR